MGFSGLVISDDIFMGALSKNGYPPEKACVEAIGSGVDVIMLSEKKFGLVLKILILKAEEDENFAKELNRAIKNVIKSKIKLGILEMIEIPDENDENFAPKFFVRTNPNTSDFDLYKFDTDYNEGMKSFDMGK